LFTGREFDRVTGLQYNRARYYDSTTGRWTTQDPIGFDGGDSNLYRYVKNNPTNEVDPSGLVLPGSYLGPPGRRHSFPNKESVDKLIKDLDSEDFPTRQRASESLERLIQEDSTGYVEKRLRRELECKPSLELRRRIEKILEKYEQLKLKELKD